MSNTRRVFITGAGGAGTIEIIRSLRAKGRYEIIVADASPYSAGLALADRGYVIPFGSSPAFRSRMRELLQLERPAFVIPLVDEELPIVHALVAEEFRGKITVVAPCLEFCTSMLDKWEMYQRLSEHRLSVARTWLASEAQGKCEFPAIIKPREGRGSRGFAYIDSAAELTAYLSEASLPPDRYIVQERLMGAEYTTSAVVTLSGETLAVVPKEVLSKKGITQLGATREVPSIDRLCRDIQERLKANGPFNVQLVLDKNGTPWVFEVNPRYSTTVALTLAAGIDEVDCVLRQADGLSNEPLKFQPDLLMIRYQTQLYVPEAEWAKKFGTTEASH